MDCLQLKFDSWAKVDEAIKKEASLKPSERPRAILVAFLHSWNPAALHMVKELERIRREREKEAKGGNVRLPIFLIDAEAEANLCVDLG